MPGSPHHPRYNPYGERLPDLVSVPRQSLVDLPQNKAIRQYLLDLLETKYAYLYDPELHGWLRIMLQLKAGRLQQKVVIWPRFEHIYMPDESPYHPRGGGGETRR